MKRNKYFYFLFMSFALLSMVLGVSIFFAIIISALFSVLFKTDSAWVYYVVGGPLAVLFATFWTIKRWAFVEAFVTE
ncbi:hypothetical protein DND58_06490 [Pseudomonas syringae pv. pisi]|nr:hypothetical protein DND62_09470 [Pseudomonas syringae pv. pisi]PYD31988.1 hypothetical protein DND58_06490 [Pseudomonas syringae pv. pisi]PYD34866.1 hypothetical protein DND67_06375 [Pseudomonas syringae pv. pisi]